MTEQEKQMMMAILMKQQGPPPDLGGRMTAPPQGGPPQQYSGVQAQSQQSQAQPGMNQAGEYLANRGGVPASGAGSALTATEAASFAPAYAPESLAIGGSTANAGVGTAAAGNAGSGAAAAGGLEAGAGAFALPAAAMAGLIKGGEELEIGAGDQLEWYKSAGRKIDSEVIDKLKFWEWF